MRDILALLIDYMLLRVVSNHKQLATKEMIRQFVTFSMISQFKESLLASNIHPPDTDSQGASENNSEIGKPS